VGRLQQVTEKEREIPECTNVIVMAKLPGEGHGARQSWQALLATIEPITKDAAIRRLAENVWQVDFQQLPSSFARLIFSIAQHKLQYGILPLEHPPHWLPLGFDPSVN